VKTLTWKVWKWPSIIRDLRLRLAKIREISSVYYNDSKFVRITKLTE